MRIGIEAQRIFRPNKHGMDIVTIELIRHLQKIDLTNEYFIFVRKDKDICLFETPNFKIVLLPSFNYAVWEQIILPIEANKYNLDILHCTSNTAPLFVKAKLIVTIHDIIYLEKTNNLSQYKSWYQKLGNIYRAWNIPNIIRKTDAVITVSDYEKSIINKHFQIADNKVVAIHNGVSEKFKANYPNSFYNSIKSKYNLPNYFLFFLGNKDPKKNLINTLMAYHLVWMEHKIPLVIADISQSYLKELIIKLKMDESILKSIFLPGYIKNEDLPGVYHLSSVFLYTSLRESFGLPLLEAMACGVPVITSNTSSMPEIAYNSAVFVNPTDAMSIAKGIMDVLTNPLLSNHLKEQGKTHVQKFTWIEVAEKTLAIYHKVFDQKKYSLSIKNH
ncbi:MAG: glycosyltransferase family 1 protein [Bacteroidota bacterium]|nr:glycosyltransferase family 1 protein [Bacteroidota bacterium]